ncbi:hypothetical protein LZ32DRAFT_358094 [Colletotrichum eremochloae]|nr:hypothetical protein LZ32DRAFT_358094 [Colletotrichum eremochloae]
MEMTARPAQAAFHVCSPDDEMPMVFCRDYHILSTQRRYIDWFCLALVALLSFLLVCLHLILCIPCLLQEIICIARLVSPGII